MNSSKKERQRAMVARRVLAGKSDAEIVEETGMSKGAVVRDRRAMVAEWRARNVGEIGDMIVGEMMRIENLEEVVMREFEMSRESLTPIEYAALMGRGMSMEEIDEEMRKRERVGNPKYLEMLMGLSGMRMKLIGAIGGNDNRKQSMVQYNFGSLSEEEMRRIVGKMQDEKFEEGK